MKKFLAILLALMLCVSTMLTLVGCNIFAPGHKPDDANGATLDKALEYFTSIYKDDENKSTQKDYNLVAKVVIDGTSFDVTYTVDSDKISIALDSNTGLYVVDLPSENAEEFVYTITATIKDAAGTTVQYTMHRKLPVYEAGIAGIVTEPVADTPYKLFMEQNSIGKVLFVTAEASGVKYLKTNVDPKAAPDWYVEVADGGYKIYTLVSGVKNYLYATAAPKADNPNSFNKVIALSAENATVFKYKADINAWYTTINTSTTDVANNIDFAMGTYSTYDTLCISETSHFTAENTGVSQFPLQFITKAAGEAMAPTTGPADPTELTSIADAIAIGAAKESNTYTVEKYLVEGVITEIKSTTYGNMYISDGTNSLYIYGLYSADGSTRYDAMTDKPQVGDTIRVMAIVGQYNGEPQLKNAWLISKTGKVWTDAEKVAAEKNALVVNVDNTVKSSTSITLPAAGTTHTDVVITWAIDTSYTGAAATLENGVLTVTLQKAAETLPLVATLKAGNVTDTKAISVAISALPTIVPVKVDAPAVGSSYKFALDQKTINKFLYFAGTVSSAGFAETTEDYTLAVDITIEAVNGQDGAYRLSYVKNGNTYYLEVFKNSSGKIRFQEVTEPTMSFTWDAENGIYVATIDDTEYYMGTYSDFNTFSASKKSYMTNEGNFTAYFFNMVDASTISDADKVAAEKDALSVTDRYTTEGEHTLPVAGSSYDNVVISWAISENEYVKVENGKLVVTKIPAATDFETTLTATLAIGSTSVTKEFKITIATTPVSTIADVLAGQAGFYKAEGVVIAVNAKSFLLKDSTGIILVYMNAVPDVAVGETLNIMGTTSVYNNVVQFGNTSTWTKGATVTVTHPEPIVLDAAAVDAYQKTFRNDYVQLTGTLSAGSYFNVAVNGAALQGSLTYLADDLKTAATALNGKVITVKGYVTGISSGKYLNLMVTEVKEATLTAAEKVAFEKEALSIETSFASNATLTLAATGSKFSDVAITWTVNGAAVEGSYAIVRAATEQTLTVVATLTCGDASATKEFTVTVAKDDGTTVKKYTFSEYPAGKQYALNEEHKLDDNITVISDNGHFTSELRLYDSASNDSTAVIKDTLASTVITSVTLNVGKSAGTLAVYGSTDGENWTIIKTLTVSSTYTDYSVDIDASSGYTYLKLDSTGSTQLRIKYFSITLAPVA